MEILGYILFIIGMITGLIYGIILLVKAFQTHILWGVGSLLLSPVMLIFVIMNWDEAKKPFLMNMVATALIVGGIAMMPGGALQL